MTPGEHLDHAESWLRYADRSDVSAAPMVSALCVLKALTHATIAHAQIAAAESVRFQRGELEE